MKCTILTLMVLFGIVTHAETSTDYSQHGKSIECMYNLIYEFEDRTSYVAKPLIGKIQYLAIEGRFKTYAVDFTDSLKKLGVDMEINYGIITNITHSACNLKINVL